MKKLFVIIALAFIAVGCGKSNPTSPIVNPQIPPTSVGVSIVGASIADSVVINIQLGCSVHPALLDSIKILFEGSNFLTRWNCLDNDTLKVNQVNLRQTTGPGILDHGSYSTKAFWHLPGDTVKTTNTYFWTY